MHETQVQRGMAAFQLLDLLSRGAKFLSAVHLAMVSLVPADPTVFFQSFSFALFELN